MKTKKQILESLKTSLRECDDYTEDFSEETGIGSFLKKGAELVALADPSIQVALQSILLGFTQMLAINATELPASSSDDMSEVPFPEEPEVPLI